MRLSIVAPMYNEASGLATFAAQLDDALEVLDRRFGLRRDDVEVILVDDGSTDGTRDAVERLARERSFEVRAHDRNRGLGAALWTGYDAATGDVIVAVDSDCTYPLVEIADLLELLDDRTGIVTASPYHPRGGVEGVAGTRLLLSRTLSLLYSAIVGRRIHTWTAMFRAYRREALEAVPWRSTDFVAVTQMLIFPMLAGYTVREHPTVLRRRRHGSSKMKVLRVIDQHLRFIAWLIPRRLGLLPLKLR